MNAGPIMILAGGTGGHVFPGLAVAEVLRERARSVVWMGTREGLEARLVPEAGIDIEWISVSGIRGRGPFAWLIAPFRIVLAVYQALVVLRRCRPVAVLGFGGFVSGPGGVAAWLARRPLLIHEQNAVAGTTNRILARFARRIFSAFPDSYPPSVQAELIGNPVRNSIVALPVPSERFASRSGSDVVLRVLVLGGSQGASVLNTQVPAALQLLSPGVALSVWHQAGRGLADAERAYSGTGVAPRLDAFIDDMAAAYGWADIVVCRAGALTISELAAAGIGAVLIPFPLAIDDHQLKNAQNFASRGAGIVVPENELNPERLAQELSNLIKDHTALVILAEKARAQANPRAAEILADACLEFAEVRP
jgi:UDP-N-acetylglucosamine--N-acetylmuramyl-(pentapeptide) pyrophosphoryl-undecaprenol N-acetylglucosamine transferase